ncbi:MAG TPA: uroporphyrinogen-III synthase [Polyangiaceae bacterium]|nr:uroporphyrinogen-III synthase [Polyangiaceae bacterium]
MNSKPAVSPTPIIPPPKSRVNAMVAGSAPVHRAASSPPLTGAEALSQAQDEVRVVVDRLIAGRYDVLIFMTGNSVSSLLDLARELGRQEALVHALRAMKTACSGPKAAALLRRFGVQRPLGECGPFTMRRLRYSLGRLELEGRRVLRLDGAPGDSIAAELRAQRARLRECSITRRRRASKVNLPD